VAVVERFRFAEVEALRVGRFTSQLNTTCILYRLGDTVIDTGPPNQWRLVRRFLEERSIGRVLVTHHHEDHAGNLGSIERTFRAPVLSPAVGFEPLAGGFPLQPYRRLIWGRPLRVEPQPLPDRLEVEGGLSLIPLHAPGHSRDMTCFLAPERGWLFSGDAYIASRPRYLRADEDLGQQIESLRRLLALEFDTLLCSHRGVIEEGQGALRRKLDYLEGLRQEARALHAQGLGRAEITRRLLGREGPMRWLTGFHFSKRNLIRACLRADPDQSMS
jgi:glyoxylase-like metal-dependent hydrolase (beta-lactamase superfamily II)